MFATEAVAQPHRQAGRHRGRHRVGRGRPRVVEIVTEAAEWPIAATGLRRVDVATRLPRTGAAWGVTGSVWLVKDLGDRWPACADDLTPPMRRGVEAAIEHYDVHAAVQAERRRIELNEAMADLFEQADVVLAATNPDVAFAADASPPTTFGGLEAKPINHGALTIPSDIYGNPAISLSPSSASALAAGRARRTLLRASARGQNDRSRS